MGATAPVTADVDIPPGFWVRDEHHLAPLAPLQRGIWTEAMSAGFRTAMARYGLPVGGFSTTLINGWVYGTFEALQDGAEIGRRIETRLALASDAEVQAARHWLDDLLPGWVARRRQLGSGLAEATDADVAERVAAAAGGLAEFAEARFSDIVIAALIGEWVLTAAELLGWDELAAVTWLRGHSGATTALARAIGALDPSSIDAVALAEIVCEHGDLMLGTDVLSPTVGEQANLFGQLAQFGSSSTVSQAGEPDLSGIEAAARPRVLAALASARLAQTWREATGDEGACWIGVLRRVGLEAGTRLQRRDLLDVAEDALFLTALELTNALAASTKVTALVAERRVAYDAGVANPPSLMIGEPPSGPPGPPPGLEFPSPVARAMAAFGWIGQHLGSPPGPPVVDATAVTGVGVAPGRVEGIARVISDVADLGDVEPGDVVVCPITSPAWDPILAVAGALVCDGGGFISHPALMAREFGIPAVVGTKVATSVFHSGQRVVVDGDAGTVQWL